MRHRLQLGCLLLLAFGLAGCDSATPAKPRAEPTETLLVQQLTSEGEPLALIELPAGNVKVARRLRPSGGDPPFRLASIGGRLVYGGAGGTYAIDLDLKGEPQKLGEAWYFVPSASDGRVWLTSLDPNSPDEIRDLRSVAEVTVKGRVTTRAGEHPPCGGPSVIAAVEGALLCQAGDELRVFDPTSGKVLRRLPGPFPLDTRGDVVAWCAERCPRIHLTDIATGDVLVVAPGSGFHFEASYEGAFSPDGTLLAVPVLQRDQRQVALIDVADGKARVIEGATLSGNRNMTWSSSGRWLFLDAGDGRVSAHDPDSGHTTLLPFKLEGQLLDMAAD